MRDEQAVIEDMKKMGLTEYESKAYLKLLQNYPANGYSLSKNSGIPRSRIYEVLDSLKNKQMVFEQEDGRTSLYYPLEPELMMKRFKKQYNDMFNNVGQYTKLIYAKQENKSKHIVIRGRKDIIEFLNSLVSTAKKRIALSIWEEELQDISESLDDALDRGVILRGIYFGENRRYNELITHRRIDRYLSEKKERYMIVTVDGLHLVSGIVSREEDSQVSWTTDSGLVEVSEDYIAHDLMVNLYSYKLDEKERKEYEEYMDKVRRYYYAYSDEDFKDLK